MRNHRFSYLAIVILSLLAVSCSGSHEAVTRKDQEQMFRELFGFEPPKTIEIQYRDVYNRYLFDDAWGRWMRFTYDADVFSRILKDAGYKPRDPWVILTLVIQSRAAPKWWPKVDEDKTTIYLRSSGDIPQSDGSSFEEYLWHDQDTNFVYFYKYYGG